MLQNLSLTVLDTRLAVCQFDTAGEIPAWTQVNLPLRSVTFTEDEISVVLPQESIPAGFNKCEKGWCIIKIDGKLDFNLCGVLSSILNILTKISVSVFVLSTFNTDYILVKEKHLAKSILALRKTFTVKEE